MPDLILYNETYDMKRARSNDSLGNAFIQLAKRLGLTQEEPADKGGA